MKILLSLPQMSLFEMWGQWSKGSGNNSFSYGMASIGAVAEADGFQVEGLDPTVEEYDEKAFVRFLHEKKYDVIGLPCYTAYADYIFRTVRIIKRELPETTVVIGGIHPTILPKETLEECPEIDFIVLGEGEYVFRDIIRTLRNGNDDFSQINGIGYRDKSGKIQLKEKGGQIKDLDELPLPAYHLFPMKKYIPQPTIVKRLPTYCVTVSRGCAYLCSFCNATEVHGKKVRYKSVPKLVEELKYLKDVYNARGIAFQDSTMTINKKWMTTFCETMIKENLDIVWVCYSRVDNVTLQLLHLMRKAGCWSISYGIESGNQKSLDLIKKGTNLGQAVEAVKWSRQAGLYVQASFILGLPGETEENMKETIRFAYKLGSESSRFFLPIPYPKSRLFEQCHKDGGIRSNAKWSDGNLCDYDNPIYVNPLIGKEKMIKIWRTASRQYYFYPKIFLRNLFHLRSMDDLKTKWRALKVLLKH